MMQNSALFESSVFGIIALLVVGASWCVTGIVMSAAPKQKVDPGIFQGVAAAVNVLISLMIILPGSSLAECDWDVVGLVFLNDIAEISLNFYAMILMSRAMQLGPNGIIWGIVQSCMIIPFLMGCLFLGESFTLMGGIGACVLLAGLGCYSLSQDNRAVGTAGNNSWKKLAFGAMILCGLSQTLTTLPSYFDASQQIPSVFRILGTGCGTMLAMFFAMWINARQGAAAPGLIQTLKNPALWKLVLLFQGVSLPLNYCLLYPGMNALGIHGLARISYPLMVGACIISFTITSIVYMKERVGFWQILAMLCCLSALVFLCL